MCPSYPKRKTPLMISTGHFSGNAAVLATDPSLEAVAADVAAEEKRYAELQLLAIGFAREGASLELDRMVSAGLPVNLRNHKGHTLLMLAAYHGHADTVDTLLARGADPDARNDRGQTPLGGAAFKGHDAVVKVLLENGADAKADQGFGLTAAGYAMMFGRFGTARLIRKHIAESKGRAA